MSFFSFFFKKGEFLMQLISLELGKDQKFWFLEDVIVLNSSTPKSPLFDLEEISYESKNIIESSIKRLMIKAYTSNGDRINSILETNFIDGEFMVSVDDIEEEQQEEYKIMEVTVSDNSEEDEDEEVQITQEDYSSAKKLLNKNGNTIKKFLASSSFGLKDVGFLSACLEIETSSKARNGIIELLENKIRSFTNGEK